MDRTGVGAGAALALTVLLTARLIANRLPTYAAGTGVTTIAGGLRWSLALFFVPALAVRYGVNFGTSPLAAATGGVIVLAAAIYAIRDGLPPSRPGRRVMSLAQLSLATMAGRRCEMVSAFIGDIVHHDQPITPFGKPFRISEVGRFLRGIFYFDMQKVTDTRDLHAYGTAGHRIPCRVGDQLRCCHLRDIRGVVFDPGRSRDGAYQIACDFCAERFRRQTL
jgi:hypothetical protein